jgi:hypothetical protein
MRDAQAYFASAGQHLRMYSCNATFPEACALVVGYDSASDDPFLDDFQQWLGARHGGRSELAFWNLILSEAIPDVNELSPDNLSRQQDECATKKLFTLLGEFFAIVVD